MRLHLYKLEFNLRFCSSSTSRSHKQTLDKRPEELTHRCLYHVGIQPASPDNPYSELTKTTTLLRRHCDFSTR